MSTTRAEAFEKYLKTGVLPYTFIGLDGAPNNNAKWYRERERFAQWAAERFAVGRSQDRQCISLETISDRLGVAVAVRSSHQPVLEHLVAILLLESSGTNAGFGQDRHGTSLAIGPMQTKWAAVMDGGLPYEAYLDILTDRNPLVGIDAGVGYFLRLFRLHSLVDAVAKYNNPSTNAQENPEYLEAFDKAQGNLRYALVLAKATAAFKRTKHALREEVPADRE